MLFLSSTEFCALVKNLLAVFEAPDRSSFGRITLLGLEPSIVVNTFVYDLVCLDLIPVFVRVVLFGVLIFLLGVLMTEANA